MPYIEVENGIKVFVEDLNPKGVKTVVLIHGWPVNHKMYEYQLNILPKYGFRCVAIDLRGFGNSDCPWDGYSYDRMADDIRVILDTLDLQNITLVGFSMGGAIAIRYMARHSNHRVTKLALLSTAAPSFSKTERYPYGMTKEEVDNIILNTYKDRPQMLTDLGSMFFANIITPSFKNWFQSLGLDTPGYSIVKCAEALRDEDLSDDLQKIKAKTGIFHGEGDRICSFQCAIEMNKEIKDSELYSFKNSGHGIFYDNLEKFNNIFLGFLMS